MTFASPAWLWVLLLLLPLFALRIRAQTSNRRSLEGLVAPRLYPLLVQGTSQVRHWLTFVFTLLGLALIIVAMARPQLGFEEVESFSEGRSVILAIDTSRSMLATDLSPNRLERAKLAARDIVDGLGEDRIGLMAFAGKAFMQAPLTTDHQAVIESIEQIDTEIIPRGGTNLTAAANLALSSFREEDAEQNALIIFSDGEALEGQSQVQQIKEDARRERMIIITIGVGTENGSIIPEPGRDGRPQENAFVKDARGQVVRTRLDSSALQELATGGGIYLQLGDRASLTRVVKNITANLDATREKDVAQQRPIERFMWPLALGFLFLVFSHVIHLLFVRRPLKSAAPTSLAAKAVGVVIVLFASGTVADAKDGWTYIDRENYESALRHFAISLEEENLSNRERIGIHLGIGSAAYKLRDYEKATKAFGSALIGSDKKIKEQAHYNLGNTLFRIGETTLNPPSANPAAPTQMAVNPEHIAATLRQWIGALEHYQAALEINEDNADARHNIEVLKKRIEELKEEQQQQPEEEPQDEQEQEQEPEKQDQPEDKNQDKGDQEESKPNESNQEENEGDSDSKKDPADPSEGNENKSGENEGENDEQKSPEESSPANPENSGEEESNQPPDPGEGELKADESEPVNPAKKSQAENRKNPATNYSPSEARQLIEALADEDGELRPVYPRPYNSEKFKNW